MNKRPKNVKKT